MDKKYSFYYESYASRSEMTESDRELAYRALKACDNAFAPYSNFKVGAAARLRSGRIMTGSNQESEVYPAGMCAERTLLLHWQARHSYDPMEAMAIASIPAPEECYPCGGCRQVLLDCERRQGSPIRVIMCGETTASVVLSAADLLPLSFTL